MILSTPNKVSKLVIFRWVKYTVPHFYYSFTPLSDSCKWDVNVERLNYVCVVDRCHNLESYIRSLKKAVLRCLAVNVPVVGFQFWLFQTICGSIVPVSDYHFYQVHRLSLVGTCCGHSRRWPPALLFGFSGSRYVAPAGYNQHVFKMSTQMQSWLCSPPSAIQFEAIRCTEKTSVTCRKPRFPHI